MDGQSDGPGHHIPCPDQSKIGLSVRLRQGDLMLCDSCNNYRFPEVAVARAPQINTELCQKSDELAVKRRDAAQSECSPSVKTDSKRVAEVNELLCFLHNKYLNHKNDKKCYHRFLS